MVVWQWVEEASPRAPWEMPKSFDVSCGSARSARRRRYSERAIEDDIMSRTDLTRAQKLKLLDARMNEQNDALKNPEIAKLK